MKSVKSNGIPARGTGHQGEMLYDKVNEGSISDNKGQEESRMRTLENLRLALFFCQAQGRMARGEQ
ncbi:hypothetical protein [Parapedobacter sp. 10938]|uniref:hypothetical protein n=1 Tax=Parapedobacter flavus TaxID=3110225 RepID=UPI002DBAEAB6|nr:hypothetical protein [Parapedobacter sp. 10938]MEC3878672.1 hypothetical protein [Parapedobacter sp. 10938]